MPINDPMGPKIVCAIEERDGPAHEHYVRAYSVSRSGKEIVLIVADGTRQQDINLTRDAAIRLATLILKAVEGAPDALFE